MVLVPIVLQNAMDDVRIQFDLSLPLFSPMLIIA